MRTTILWHWCGSRSGFFLLWCTSRSSQNDTNPDPDTQQRTDTLHIHPPSAALTILDPLRQSDISFQRWQWGYSDTSGNVCVQERGEYSLESGSENFSPKSVGRNGNIPGALTCYPLLSAGCRLFWNFCSHWEKGGGETSGVGGGWGRLPSTQLFMVGKMSDEKQKKDLAMKPG